jgi:hypothetical protein
MTKLRLKQDHHLPFFTVCLVKTHKQANRTYTVSVHKQQYSCCVEQGQNQMQHLEPRKHDYEQMELMLTEIKIYYFHQKVFSPVGFIGSMFYWIKSISTSCNNSYSLLNFKGS